MMRPTPASSPSGKTYRSMKAPVLALAWLSARVMQWLSSRPPGRSLLLQQREVGVVVRDADVLEQADRADCVVVAARRVAVVAVDDRDLVRQAEPVGLGLRPRGLLLRQRHGDDVDAVVRGGVARHAAPPATDVEQAHSRPEPELARDEVELRVLGVVQADVRLVEDGAGVGHRRPEHVLVEAVGHVVVLADRLAVAAPRVPQADERAPGTRRRLLRRGLSAGAADAARAPGRAPAARPSAGTPEAPVGPGRPARGTGRRGARR